MVVVPISDGVPGAAVTGPATFPSGLACVDTARCVAVGGGPEGGGVVPIRDGAPGAARAIAGTGFLSAVACGTDGGCTAVGVDESFAQGVVVRHVRAPDVAVLPVSGTAWLIGIACPSGRSCLAVGVDGSFAHGVVDGVAISSNSPIPHGVGQVPPITEMSTPLGPYAYSNRCLYWLTRTIRRA